MPASPHLSFALSLSLLACALLVWATGDTTRARLQTEPAPVIPGMPPCGCAPACDYPAASPGPQDTPAPSPPPPTPTVEVAPKEMVPTAGKVVAVDPGHGGKETGAVSRSGLAEKDANLRIGLKLAGLLRAGGYVPVLTRDGDRQVNTAGQDLNANGAVDVDDDLQARVDVANASHADILVSIHNNGAPDSSRRGTQTYYCAARPFSQENVRLAASLQAHLIRSMRSAGYDPVDQGIADDPVLKKPFGHLFLLGPLTPRVARASNMPGALGETLYLTNPTEAAWLAREDMLSAIARGYYEGIVAYFGRWAMDDGR